MINPTQQLEYLDLHPGHKVLECGIGAGIYAIEMARRVGATGEMHACDIQKPLLDKFLDDLQRANLANGKTHWVDLDEKKSLGECLSDSMDRVLVANTLWQLEQPQNLFDEAARILKPGGKMLVIGWTESHNGIGPHADHIVHPDRARHYIQDVGLEISKESFDVGEYHYGFVCSKK